MTVKLTEQEANDVAMLLEKMAQDLISEYGNKTPNDVKALELAEQIRERNTQNEPSW